ncbi:hypothetical protein ACHAXA_010619 [Cyclostephanos tholiformis]|uniref:Uncharacterized protein n=1 Tax=Cyclostephanos tholiformis TaxID=382380 RepID=A0ABD3R8F5_9STRA
MSQISNSRDGSSHEETTTSGGDKRKKDKEQKLLIMTFPLGRHVNLEGFRAAKAKAGGGVVNNSTSSVILPSLFYVALPDLLRRFIDEFFDGTALSLGKQIQTRAVVQSCPRQAKLRPIPASWIPSSMASPAGRTGSLSGTSRTICSPPICPDRGGC